MVLPASRLYRAVTTFQVHGCQTSSKAHGCQTSPKAHGCQTSPKAHGLRSVGLPNLIVGQANVNCLRRATRRNRLLRHQLPLITGLPPIIVRLFLCSVGWFDARVYGLRLNGSGVSNHRTGVVLMVVTDRGRIGKTIRTPQTQEIRTMERTNYWLRIVALALLLAVTIGHQAVLADDSWESVSAMADGRRFHGAALGDDGFIYAVGGSEWGGAPAFSSVERYNPQTNTWSPATPMHTARHGHGVINACCVIYAIGGADENGVKLGTMETYDVCTETWTISPYMLNVPRAFFGVTVDHCGKIYAIGGDDGTNALASVEVFDTKNAGIGWQMLGCDLSVARRHLGAGTDQEGRIYAIAGIPASGPPIDSVERFDPADPTPCWEPGPPLNQGRQMGAYATASDGKIFVLGGWNSSNLLSALKSTTTRATAG